MILFHILLFFLFKDDIVKVFINTYKFGTVKDAMVNILRENVLMLLTFSAQI